ncbi:hypothetical protein ES703_86592 [subsurface metagenome]
METKHEIITRQLPKTGQVTSYADGDDGYYQKGWWKGLTVAGNKTRFVSKTLDGDDVVIDLATGLMWPADAEGAGGNSKNTVNWDTAIAYANGLDFAGFTDWRIPNSHEFVTLMNLEQTVNKVPTGFFTGFGGIIEYWTSTTYSDNTPYAYELSQLDATIKVKAKTTENFSICVRTI